MLKKIFGKLITVFFIIISFTILILITAIYHNVKNENFSNLESQINLIIPAVEKDGVSYLKIFNKTYLRSTLITQNGKVVYDSHADKDRMDNHINRQEVVDAIKFGEGKSLRFSDTIEKKTYYFAKLLPNGYILRLSREDKSPFSIFVNLINIIVLIIFIAIVFIIIFSLHLVKSLSKDINSIDVENPLKNIYYSELSPLISKMVKQKSKVSDKIGNLRKKREELRAITENMSEVFIIIDSNTSIVSFNKSAQRLFPEIKKLESQSVFVINRTTEFINWIQDALEGKKISSVIEFDKLYYQLITNPIYDDEQKVSGAVIFMQDISERYSRDMLRREFSSNVSHELKTPLTSIIGIAEIMKNGIVKQEDISNFASKIHNESKRLLAMVNDIIKISRIDDANSNFVKSDISLRTIVKEVYEVLEFSRQQKNIDMILELQDVRILGVRQLVFEMVYNLCDNAIKYNKEDGNVLVSLKKNDEEIRLSVKDTGIGIEKRNIDRIFERFYCVDSSRSKLHGGTGLGLSIVKHTAALHGAEIEVESEVGVGTEISIIWNKI